MNKPLILFLIFVIICGIYEWCVFDMTDVDFADTNTSDIVSVELISQPQTTITTTVVIHTTTKQISTTKETTSTAATTAKMSYQLSDTEAYQLCKIAMAEAQDQDTEGKALVMLVVLNRVESNDFPNTIWEVITQPHQFEAYINGRYDRLEPDEDCVAALELIESGWNESQGALFFEMTQNVSSWQSRNLNLLFIHQDHSFYK